VDNWDLSEARSVVQRKQPNFKFNIYSETMGDFVLEEDTDNTSVSVLVSMYVILCVCVCVCVSFYIP